MKIMKMIVVLSVVSMLSLTMLLGCKKKNNLYVYTWADYIDPSLISQFEKENNCNVVIDTFDCNESLFAKLMAGANGYDIIMPTEYIMPQLVSNDLIMKVDTNMLPNAVENVDPLFLSKWSMTYNVPYAFSCTGILWRKDKTPKDLAFNDWNDMFDERLSGKICMMNDIREVVGLALKMKGFSVNSTNKEEIAEATTLAKEWKTKCTKMDNESYRTGIPSKEFFVAMAYNSDAVMLLADDKDNIGYVVPTNGTTSSKDVFCIMKDSKSKELAHKFIDMFFIVSNAVKNAEFNCAPMPVAGLYDALSDEYKSIPFMKVTPELKAKCEDIEDVGSFLNLYTEAWDKIKGSK